MLLDHLATIPDFRRGQGRMYTLPHILLFSIFAVASGANSYRDVVLFMEEHRETLCKVYGLTWRRSPSYNCIRRGIQGINPKEAERAFRAYAAEELESQDKKLRVVSLDGKALRHSFDHIIDKPFKQVLSAYSPESNLILAHQSVGTDKEHEINAAITLLKELKIDNVLFTFDALHTQKNARDLGKAEGDTKHRSGLSGER